MKNIYLISLQTEFAESVNTAYIIEAMDIDFELAAFDTVEKAFEVIARRPPDMLVVSYEALITRNDWKFDGVEIVYLAGNKKELAEGAKYGLKTIGIAGRGTEVIGLLKKEPYYVEEPAPEKKRPVIAAPPKTEKRRPAPPDEDDIPDVLDDIPDALAGIDLPDDIPEEDAGHDEAPVEEQRRKTETKKRPAYTDPTPSRGLEELDEPDDEFAMDLDYGFEDEEPEPEPEPEPVRKKAPPKKSSRERSPRMEQEEYEDESEDVRGDDKNEELADAVDKQILADIRKKADRTKIVTVYSAKGGVGKTKISTELALYLSMVTTGKRDLRVCLVDCNIDFGDVRGTLHMGAKGPNMTYWADEIQEAVREGRTDIKYSRSEIERHLRKEKDSGLYVLVAPLTNEDSMNIDTATLRIMFDNLIAYGDFDYIVCDTGNNTRDSTMIAIEKADTILMIMVQDVNTANCNLGFISTMRSIDWDTSRIRMIINKIKAEKATSISVQEIVEYFGEYPCVGKIRYNPDVEISTNEGKPLAFKAEHEFTKQMKSVVAYVLNNEEFNDEPEKKKKSLFSRFKKKPKKE